MFSSVLRGFLVPRVFCSQVSFVVFLFLGFSVLKCPSWFSCSQGFLFSSVLCGFFVPRALSSPVRRPDITVLVDWA